MPSLSALCTWYHGYGYWDVSNLCAELVLGRHLQMLRRRWSSCRALPACFVVSSISPFLDSWFILGHFCSPFSNPLLLLMLCLFSVSSFTVWSCLSHAFCQQNHALTYYPFITHIYTCTYPVLLMNSYYVTYIAYLLDFVGLIIHLMLVACRYL